MSSQREKTIGFLTYEWIIYLRSKGIVKRTIDGYRYYSKVFNDFLADRKITSVSQIDKKIIQEYAVYVRNIKNIYGRTYSDGSIKNFLGSARSFWLYLLDCEYVSVDLRRYLKNPKTNSKLPKLPNQIQVKTFIETVDISTFIGVRNRSIIELYYSTGIRKSELINLDIDHIDLNKRVLRIINGKGNKDRTVPIGEIALFWLKNYVLESRKHFSESDKEKSLYLTCLGGRISLASIDKLFKRINILSRMSVKITPQILRHSCATHMLQRGANLRYIQKLLGHKNLTTTQIYTQVITDDIHKTHKLYHPRGTFSLQKYSK